MYTSGWPKNQNRCCHSKGEPPLCGISCSLTTSPPGTKKLVPALRSSNSRMPPASNTGNPRRLRIAVTSQFQQVNGICIMLNPGRRLSSTVAMKLMALSVDATQNTARLMIQSVCPPPCPGPATAPIALSGG